MILQNIISNSTELEKKFTIVFVISSYNPEFVNAMVEHAYHEISIKLPYAKVINIYTPGTFEIPYCVRLAIRYQPDAIICFGVILEGETHHAHLIANSVTQTICQMSVDFFLPILNAILFLKGSDQAVKRCHVKETNRGTEIVNSLISILQTKELYSNYGSKT